MHFYRGIPFIWCSNNLTTSFAIQCYWYKQLTGDKTFDELEQANFDWLFGCNPWGTSMVYGLPSWGDTPVDPHSAFTHLKIIRSMGAWLMVLFTQAFIKILSALHFISLMSMKNFKAILQFIMMTMEITAPMNQQWMEQLR